MKPIVKSMLKWLAVYIAVGLLVWAFNLDWSPLLDFYHDATARQIAVWATIGALLVAWVWLIIDEEKKRRALNKSLTPAPVPPAVRKPVELILWYTGDQGQMMTMPVDGLWHAQHMLDLLAIRVGAVSDKHTGCLLYATDNAGNLVAA